MIALLSDVHANLEALRAVMEDVDRRNIKSIFFLGDIVGYGPNPLEVLDYLNKFKFCLLGNHDEAALKGPPKNFNPRAQQSTIWTRKQIDPESLPHKATTNKTEYERRKKNWQFLESLQPLRALGSLLFVHDYPAAPGSWKYVRKSEDAVAGLAKHPERRAIFIGHTHVAGIFTEAGRYGQPKLEHHYGFTERMVINVGSVGQPRDRDPRASYLILDEGFTFVRVAYDIEKTVAKIKAIDDLDDQLGERLREGK